jgi:hypothetical protein
VSTERFFSAHWSDLAHKLPGELVAHLRSERETLTKVLDDAAYAGVIEAGCADGSLMWPVVRDRGLRYFGVDLAGPAIDVLRTQLPDGSQAVRGDVVDLPRLVHDWDAPAPWLTVFPFNLIGVLVAPHQALRAVAEAGSDILVLAYRAGEEVREARRKYFDRCGLTGVFTEDGDGQHFHAPGYTSSALDPKIITAMLEQAGFAVSEAGPHGLYGLSVRGATTPASAG